ncbi:MAG TPA: phosphoglycerate kinase, partial [Spirochaetes bacterium]|nr:phosphoglycerate kinase [Spirochaetota bacterium]
MDKQTIRDIDLKGKRVIIRVDFNVPQDDDLNITDTTRIEAALPTIKYILGQNASLILMSHLGRPKGKVVKKLSLEPVAKELTRLLDQEVRLVKDYINENIPGLHPGEVILLENLRFHSEEKANDPQFANKLADLADVYVDDAFGTAHRSHASTVGITKYLPAVSGFLIEKELDYLGQTLSHPKKPFVAIVGGSKISTKITVLESLLDKVDTLIIGGGMTYTFCKGEGWLIGDSLFEESYLEMAKGLIEKAKQKGVELLIPVDHMIADKFDNDARTKIVIGDIPDEFIGMDIGPKTIELINIKLKGAKTVLWNGPLGVFEMENFSKGTFSVAKTLGEIDAVTIVGGGDSVSAIKQSGVADKISHISTGGGAAIEFIEGKKLPGIEALN